MRDSITESENRMIAIVQTKHNHQQRTIDQLHAKTLERQQQSQALLNHLNHPATNVSFVMRWIEADRARPENIDIPDPFTMLLLPNVVSSSSKEFRFLHVGDSEISIFLSTDYFGGIVPSHLMKFGQSSKCLIFSSYRCLP